MLKFSQNFSKVSLLISENRQSFIFLTSTSSKKIHTCFNYLKMANSTSGFDKGAHKRIVWVDLEMSGLDIDKEHILEMSCLVTDGDLNIIAEGPEVVIKQSDEILENMGEWCKNTHGKTGLTDAVRKSKIDLKTAENMMLDFVKQHVPKGVCPLAGNSIHADRLFLNKYMPTFLEHLHYRIIDVSSIKELCKRWYPNNKFFAKYNVHRSLDDIKESIEELKHYRSTIFKKD
jgi:oligoribonuclease